MAFLKNKRALITGVASNRSIAWGIARAMHEQGAELVFSCPDERMRERVVGLAAEVGCDKVLLCDVGDDASIEKSFAELKQHWDGFDILVHAIAYAPREELEGLYLDAVSREGFNTAHEISSYSLAALTRAAAPMLRENAAVLTLTYIGAVRALPGYNVMGLAKASLEANVRYLAQSLGGRGIRVNAISAGPIRTLAAAGIHNFREMLDHFAKIAPLGRVVTSEEVGNVAAFLCSDLASAITGEITYVDAGFNTVGFSAQMLGGNDK